MVRIRLKRFGRRNRPYYRLCVMDQRTARNGKAIEELGFYDPIERDQAKSVKLNAERVKYWLGVGAQATETVHGLLRKAGVVPNEPLAKPKS